MRIGKIQAKIDGVDTLVDRSKVPYEVVTDEDGNESIGRDITNLLSTMTNGVYNVDIEAETIVKNKELVSHFTSLIESHIQTPIDNYNAANGTLFKDAHSCANYKDNAGYTHQAFCQSAWDFNVSCWEAGRAIQVDVMTTGIIPTDEEFISQLPVYGV